MKIYPKLGKTVKSAWIFLLLFCLLVERKVDQCKYNGAATLALKRDGDAKLCILKFGEKGVLFHLITWLPH